MNLCVWLHAEENALLEAGRERVGQTATLYCNTSVPSSFPPSNLHPTRSLFNRNPTDITLALVLFLSCPLDSFLRPISCPCLPCAVKIVQSGVKEVVYNLAYAMDEESARVLKEGGVELRRWRGIQ